MHIDYRQSDYTQIYQQRAELLAEIASKPKSARILAQHYRHAPWDLIYDWGHTFDPRNIELGRMPDVPFVPWPRQLEYLKWIYARWKSGKPGLVEKSRDCGVTWLSVGFACSMWLFEPGFVAGFGSRKEEMIDRRGDMQSIFERLRYFLSKIPGPLMPVGWDERQHSSERKIVNPASGAALVGEAGDQIGRAGRTSIYFVDEAAFVERQDSVDAALSMTTNCKIDVSTFNGSGNAFFRKQQRVKGTDAHFVFDWRDDPRKDQAWYDRKVAELDPVIVAQEIDRDPHAANVDSFIPAAWVAAAIDAHRRLGFQGSGVRSTGFDPADVGDAKACVNRHGSVVLEAVQLTKGEITDALSWAFGLAEGFGSNVLVYDGDGMGAPTMAAAFDREATTRMQVIAYHGSAGVIEPLAYYDHGEAIGAKQAAKQRDKRTAELHAQDKSTLRTNGDMFMNFKSQSWTWLRDRFEATYLAVERAKAGLLVNVDPDKLISISSSCKDLYALQSELSQPKRILSRNGKWGVEAKVDMKKRGVSSPNLAEALVMAMGAKVKRPAKAPPLRYDTYQPAVPGVM